MSNIKAVLGPTNTGKTHYAVERMCAHTSGVMGFPLRLLAREVYDKMVALKGKNAVALLTGEERIVPEGARYYLCTAEAMPRGMVTQFVAIDEVQMAADSQRGHVFTEHLLHSRGRSETLFLGSDTMEPLIRSLVPEAEILYRERFSKLSHIKPVKISRLPRRSVVIAFSAADVYGLAELIKRQKGGAAIVMGSLSPRTRNKQVELYQSGEVDYLVATDAIGMGLNMDIGHVVFSSTTKYDGRNVRYLTPAELGQIAGRAGRYKKDGNFTTLGGELPFDERQIAQLEGHRFDPVKAIQWRNNRLDFHSLGRLISSLEKPAQLSGVHRSRDALDMLALKSMAADDDIVKMIKTPADLQTLWDICQVPDFKKLSMGDHINLLKQLYSDLMSTSGVISHDFLARQVKRLDNTGGDIDTLAARIASIRVWTYVSHRGGWLKDGAHWAHVTRSVEDKLSDALHERLTQRFVDRRTAVLMRSLRQKGELKVDINTENNKVTVEGQEIGELNGFTFTVEAGAAGEDHKLLNAAAETALKVEITRRVKIFGNVGAKTLTFDFTNGLAAPRLMWEGAAIATLSDSGALFAPRVKIIAGTQLDGDNADAVRQSAQDWLDARIAEKMENLIKLAQELNGEVEAPEGVAVLTGVARGIAYRVLENYGVLNRQEVAADLRSLDQDARKGLRRFGIRIGATSLYIPFVLKPHATEMRLMMWAMAEKLDTLPNLPTPGMVWVDVDAEAPKKFYSLAGFTVAGAKAVRMDMFERLADATRPLGSGGEWFEVTPETMGLVGLSGEFFAGVMKTIGYSVEERDIPVPPKPVVEAVAETPAEGEAEVKAEEAVADVVEAVVDTPVEEEAVTPESTEAVTDAAEETVKRHFFKWVVKRPAKTHNRPAQKAEKKFSTIPDEEKKKAYKDNKGGKGGKRSKSDNRTPRVMSAAPKKQEKAMDPDSPFAALAGLKDQLGKK